MPASSDRSIIPGIWSDAMIGVANEYPSLRVMDYWLSHAVNVIKSTDGVDVSIDEKNKDLLKFGRTLQAGTISSTIMTLPSGTLNEAYVSDNLITHISSDNAADTEELLIEGHTISGSDLTFTIQTKSLSGQTKVALDTPLARGTRLFNNNGTDLTGTVYLYEDDTVTGGVPNTDSKVHCMIRAGQNQSEKASTSISSVDYWIITDFYADVIEKTGSPLVDVTLQYRRLGKVWRPIINRSVSNSGGMYHPFRPHAIIPANSDVRLICTSSTASTEVSAGIAGVLAKVI